MKSIIAVIVILAAPVAYARSECIAKRGTYTMKLHKVVQNDCHQDILMHSIQSNEREVVRVPAGTPCGKQSFSHRVDGADDSYYVVKADLVLARDGAGIVTHETFVWGGTRCNIVAIYNGIHNQEA